MKRLINLGIFLFLIISLLSIVIGIRSSIGLEDDGMNGIECREYSFLDTLQYSENRMIHHRSWNKYTYDSVYCFPYVVSTSQVTNSTEFRNRLSSAGSVYEIYWRNIYYELYEHDKELISFLQDSLQNIGLKNNLTKSEFAKLIVSFVQDIPYHYVTPGPCDRDDHPCRGNEKFGILSPVEFLYSLSGDCDTRSVLLYSVLKHFGYNPLIMISNEYRHAMIAIDLPASGDYVIHKGKKFYFWETTNTGWLPGMLPPGTNNVAYWKITLDHEYQTFSSRNR